MKKHRLPAAVLALAALGFTLGTCEFVIVGILPDIAAGLNVSLAAVGRLVSVFAACYAVGTPLLTALTGRDELTVGTHIIRYTTVLSNRFDSTAFKKVMPDVYKAYTKQTTSRRFSIA